MTKSKPLMLVVEPIKTYQTFIEMLARSCGYEPVIVPTCNDAFNLLAADSNAYAVVLLNWCSPFWDRLDLCKQIRNIDAQKSSHTPIVAMIAALEVDDCEGTPSIGFDDCLTKPFNARQFRFHVRKYAKSLKAA